MSETPPTEGLPPSLRLLKGLVTALTLTLIGGVITVVVVIVTRMPDAASKVPLLPDQIALPADATARAITLGTDWIGVVTDTDHFLIYDRATGTLLQDIAVQTP